MTDPVLIVGAGPTGLTAALELARFGIAVRLIDQREAPATTSRAIGIQARTLELMDQRGLAQEMVQLGNKGSGASIYSGGKRGFRMDFSQVASRFNYVLLLSQTETERILREAISRFGIAPEWSTELVGFAQDALSHDPCPVTAVLAHQDGALEQVQAPWMISAEGAHSRIRTTLNMPFAGKTLVEHFALADLHAQTELSASDLHVFSSPSGLMAIFPLGGDHFRLIVANPLGDPQRGSLPAGSPPAGSLPALHELQTAYDERSPVPAQLHDLSWSSWFRINSRMVERLRAGRLLLGGDAAHIHSPAGAQGMNTGIQDMINLCWKLAMVMKGQAPEALLDTYEADRLPIIRNVLRQTEAVTELVGAENKLARGLFNHVAPWIAATALAQEDGTARITQLALDYRGSPLSLNAFHAGAVKAGDRLPDIEVRHWSDGAWVEARLQSLLDPSGFVLLDIQGDGLSAFEPQLAEIAQMNPLLKAITLAAPFGEGSGIFRHALGESSLYLVRPDGYCAVAAGRAGGRHAMQNFLAKWLSPAGT